MASQQEIPYYVTIEVVNRQCKGLKMLVLGVLSLGIVVADRW